MYSSSVPEKTIKQEFDKTTEKSHVIACWVGIALNLIWFISDYLTINEFWVSFLYVRITVSLLSLMALVFKKKLGITIYACIFILVLGISIQNAYMWSFMTVFQFQKHAFAYMVLFIGVGMLVLWQLKLSVILLIATVVSNVVFYIAYSKLSTQEFISNGALLVLTVLIFSVFLIRNRYRLTYKEISSRLELEKSNSYIELQKESVDKKNKEINSSIRYAKRIQDALLPPKNFLNTLFDNNGFVLHTPKDIVSGDFYWASPVKTTGDNPIYLSLAAVVDCTGHGVPGAFISIVASNFLKQSLTEPSVNNTAQALDYLNENIISTLNQQSDTENQVRDGLDIALIAINYKTSMLYYSGANNPVYVFRNINDNEQPELHVLKPTKQAIGSVADEVAKYTVQQFNLQAGDTIYLFTDGYADQFGGDKNKKFTYKKFKDTLAQASLLPIDLQREFLHKTHLTWRGNSEQTDDICVMGIKI